jgi:hypothetical protein
VKYFIPEDEMSYLRTWLCMVIGVGIGEVLPASIPGNLQRYGDILFWSGVALVAHWIGNPAQTRHPQA